MKDDRKEGLGSSVFTREELAGDDLRIICVKGKNQSSIFGKHTHKKCVKKRKEKVSLVVGEDVGLRDTTTL